MDEFKQIIFNGMTPWQFAAYYLFALLALFGGFALDIYRRWYRIQEQGGFSFAYWWSKNNFRFIISLFVIFLGVLCTKDFLGSEPSIYNSILTGLGADKIIPALLKRSKKFGYDDDQTS